MSEIIGVERRPMYEADEETFTLKQRQRGLLLLYTFQQGDRVVYVFVKWPPKISMEERNG